jgi:hypothetical protein
MTTPIPPSIPGDFLSQAGTIASDLLVKGNLDVSGDSVLSGDLIADNLSLTGNLTVGGKSEISVGNESNPSLYFTGDPLTGLYQQSSGDIGFTTGGDTQFSVHFSNANTVNYLRVTGGLSNGLDASIQPKILATGTDTNVDIGIVGKGTGGLSVLANTSSANGTIKLWNGANTFYTQLQPATLTSNVSLTLPANTGTSGQVLITDGSGNTSWSNSITTANITTLNVSGNSVFQNSISYPLIKSSIGDGGNPTTYILQNFRMFNTLTQTSSTATVRTLQLPTSFSDPDGLLDGGNYVFFWLQACGGASIILTSTGSSNMTFDNQSIGTTSVTIPVNNIGQFMVTSPAPGIYQVNSLGIVPYK